MPSVVDGVVGCGRSGGDGRGRFFFFTWPVVVIVLVLLAINSGCFGRCCDGWFCLWW